MSSEALNSLYIATYLFSAGIFVMLVQRHVVFLLIGIELSLNGANLLLVAFSQNDPTQKGQIFAIFSIIITICEISIALAILLNIVKHHSTANLDKIQETENE